MPAVASQCQILPASTGYSHSIVNEPFLRSKLNDLLVGICGNTMKNTMFSHCCWWLEILTDQPPVASLPNSPYIHIC